MRGICLYKTLPWLVCYKPAGQCFIGWGVWVTVDFDSKYTILLSETRAHVWLELFNLNAKMASSWQLFSLIDLTLDVYISIWSLVVPYRYGLCNGSGHYALYQRRHFFKTSRYIPIIDLYWYTEKRAKRVVYSKPPSLQRVVFSKRPAVEIREGSLL